MKAVLILKNIHDSFKMVIRSFFLLTSSWYNPWSWSWDTATIKVDEVEVTQWRTEAAEANLSGGR